MTDEYIHLLPSFVPGSTLANRDLELILTGVERFPYALDELGARFTDTSPSIEIAHFNRERSIAAMLKERFQHYGSDKSTAHSYHLAYGEILSRLGFDLPLNILEVGIGSNNPAVPSNMGVDGRPGASLRAFRDVAQQSMVYGADIDTGVLFSEQRIRTSRVDQMDPDSFAEMNQAFGNPRYDLVIDDGLHAAAANLNTLLFGLSVLNEGGWIVIEDIWSHWVCWHTVYRLLPDALFEKYLIACPEGCYLFVLHQRSGA